MQKDRAEVLFHLFWFEPALRFSMVWLPTSNVKCWVFGTRLRTSHRTLMHDQCWICFAKLGPLLSCEPLLPFLWSVWLGPEEQGREKEPVWQQLPPLDFMGWTMHAELNDSRQARQLSGSEQGPNSMPGGWKKCCESPWSTTPRLHGTGVAELETPRARGFLNQKGASSYRRKELGRN